MIRLNTLINATFQVPVCTSRTTMSSNMIKFVCLNSLLVTRLARCPLTQPGLETAHKHPPMRLFLVLPVQSIESKAARNVHRHVHALPNSQRKKGAPFPCQDITI